MQFNVKTLSSISNTAKGEKKRVQQEKSHNNAAEIISFKGKKPELSQTEFKKCEQNVCYNQYDAKIFPYRMICGYNKQIIS